MYSAATDHKLRDWLHWAEQHGTSVLQAIATAAFLSDAKVYGLLRPTLIELREMYPETS